PELASWVQAQRSKFRSGILEEERAKLLLALGCKMKINETAKWEDRFEQLNEFIAQNGRFPENADALNNSSIKTLMTWVNSQRKAYSKGNLSDEKIKALEDLGFVWNIIDVHWNEVYDILKEFVEINGRLPKRGDIYKGVNVNAWLNNQIQKTKPNHRLKLSDEQKEKLVALGVNLSDTKFMQKWMSAYTLYIEYKNLYNQEPRQKVRYKGRDLGTWIWNQKNYLRDGTLPPERVKLLADIGVTK
ncbi:MAG: helicase associated domain-containing protein, partial [Firmicutes bacterium]|nr:helicase associated domain-containing protein [Bacillota bacterium]